MTDESFQLEWENVEGDKAVLVMIDNNDTEGTENNILALTENLDNVNQRITHNCVFWSTRLFQPLHKMMPALEVQLKHLQA